MEFNTQVTAHKDDTYALAINVDYGFFTPDDFIPVSYTHLTLPTIA